MSDNVETKVVNRVDARNILAQKCKEFRESKQISVESIAKLVGVTRQTIYSFERGEIDSMSILYYYLILGVSI